ncbi:LysR family transcriptional regulator [uncultured Massilia sp.]|uniref:LysR family transcriptional regulator n=1 Tax=uncultured Massilia sp. TaxID=169973 RepID=UPI0025D1C907|nr:LysR family transcriptional regulator [uncultured Massilia sp.]
MELRHLRYFVVVAEEGHFTRAAERLGMQQPPLSQQIRALEQELGFELFRRHPKGAALTAGGEAFLQEARAILAGVERAVERAARANDGVDGRLAVGFTSSAAAHPLIPRIMRAYRDAWPQVELEFREGNAAELTEAIEQDKLDAAFLRRPVGQPPGIAFHGLLEEELLLVLPVGHPALAGRRAQAGRRPAVPLAALRDERFILVRRSGAPGMYADLVEACVQAGFVPHVAIEVERMLTNISLVAAGAGVSAVPASMQGFHAESVVYCAIADAPPRLAAPLTLAWRADSIRPTLRHLVDLAQRSCS